MMGECISEKFRLTVCFITSKQSCMFKVEALKGHLNYDGCQFSSDHEIVLDLEILSKIISANGKCIMLITAFYL